MWIIHLLTTLVLASNGIFCARDCEMPPILSDVTKCCDLPILIEQNLRETCLKQIDEESDGWDGIKNFTNKLKYAECIFQKGDAIIDEKPSVIEIKKMVKKILEDYTDLEGLFNAAVDRCVPEVLAKDKQSRKRASEPPFNLKNVNTIYGHLIGCIAVDLMSECPSARRGKSRECTEIINNLKKCFNDFPPIFMLAVLPK